MGWKFIETEFFLKQVRRLSKKYKLIWKDRDAFKEHFTWYVDADLWKNLAKVRLKNSSIPVWKSGGFRLIVRVAYYDDVVIPLLIYAKTIQEMVTDEEIEHALLEVTRELWIE